MTPQTLDRRPTCPTPVPLLSDRDVFDEWGYTAATSLPGTAVLMRHGGGLASSSPYSLRIESLWDEVHPVVIQEVLLPTGGRVVVSSLSAASPTWLRPTSQRIVQLLMRGAADPERMPRAEVVMDALSFLAELNLPRIAAPSIAPLNGGGLQLEWHRGGVDVEVIVSTDDERGTYVRIRATGEEVEFGLEPERLRNLVGDRLLPG